MKYPLSTLAVILLFLMLMPCSGQAQYFITGQDPASIQWKQLNTNNFKIVYPNGLDSTANRYLNLLELGRIPLSESYLDQTKKFTIVLHSHSTIANAMVSPTPMHADFFIIPDQKTYAQPWEKQLALHEYRHVAQIQKVNKGVGRALSYVFGDQAIGAMMGLFIPFWFIEGDAVLVETLFSNSGRGRSPDFSMDLKAQVLDKKIYPYDKALYGSYKDYVPDHYTLGYQLVTKGIQDYGPEIWSHALDRVARRPYTFAPFTLAIKDKTTKGKLAFYKKTMWELQQQWNEEDERLPKKHKLVDVTAGKYFTNYRFPNLSSQGIICEKTGWDDINRFVLIREDGSEEVLFTPGFDYVSSLSANDSLLVWNEKQFDKRWSNQDFSVIKSYNYKTDEITRLSQKTRYFAPDLSPDASQIVAVEATTDNRYSLVVIDAKTGDLRHRIGVSDSLFLMTPKWSDDGTAIVSVALGDQGKTIMLTHTESWENSFPFPFQFGDIKNPYMAGNAIYYIGTHSGVSNVFVARLGQTKVEQFTELRFGANDPRVYKKEGKIVYVNYTADGYRPAIMDMDRRKVNSYDWKSQPVYSMDEMLTRETFNMDKVKVPDTVHVSDKYSRLGHLFNFHSWGITAIDLNNYDFIPGVNLMSQNILSTSTANLGYYYDLNEQRGKIKAGFDYLGWYPTINITAEYAGRRTNLTADDGSKTEVLWHETNVSSTLSIPLQLTTNKWIRGFRPSVGATQKFLSLDHGTPDSISLKHDQYTLLTHGLYAYSSLKKARRSIFPRWGLYLNANLRHTLFASNLDWQSAATVNAYLPGFIRHQGFRVYAGYEQNDMTDYAFSTLVAVPRGYNSISDERLLSMKLDYVFPILYPDLNWPSIFYLKRIYGQVFYDHLLAGNQLNTSLSSAGMEIYTDWHFLSLIPAFKLGVRFNHRIESQQQNFEFLFGVSY